MKERTKAQPVAWALSPGHAGMEGQAIALLEALDLSFEVKRVAPRAPWTWLPGSSWPFAMASLPADADQLSGPYPDLLVSCGRRAAPFAAHVSAASGQKTRTVHIQDPQSGRARFDMLLIPEHDSYRGANVVTTVGSLHRVTQDRLQAARREYSNLFEPFEGARVAVLIGGSTGNMRLDETALSEFGRQVAQAAKQEGASLLITGSRRSDAAALAAFQRQIADVPHFFWDGQGGNPYFGILGWADWVVVTGDSINMICEACATRCPVHIATFDRPSAKFERFYRSMIDGGYARFFRGQLEPFQPAVLQETKRAARLVAERLDIKPPTS